MAKSILRLKSRVLRKRGLGIKTIAHQLEVSSSTVSLWCRDITLTPKQIQMLQKNAHDPFFGKRLEYIQKQQEKRIEKIRFLKEKGVKDVGQLSKRDLFIGGINLYWAEGFKKDNLVGFANSDPNMIKIFILWLTNCCNITQDRIKCRLGVNESYKQKTKELELYWSKALHIPLAQFQKPYIQKVQWKKLYDNPENYHGVLRIRVSKSIDLLRKIHGWIEGIKNTF